MTTTLTRQTAPIDLEPEEPGRQQGDTKNRRRRVAGALLALGLTAATGFVGYQAVAGGDHELGDHSHEQAEYQRQLRYAVATGDGDNSHEMAERRRFDRLQTDDPHDAAEYRRHLRLRPGAAGDTSADRAERLRMDRLDPANP